MTRDDILATIRANEPRLRELSVRELALFGSFVHGDATDASDIDFLVEFDETTFGHCFDTKELLEALFGRKVDLVIKSDIKARLRERILNEAVRDDGGRCGPESQDRRRGYDSTMSSR